VDGILYFQVTDPMRASYGASNYVVAITQLAQTTLRSVIGKHGAGQDLRGARP
jgi:regulator of protease activity HflC (stomatin/prohibitin superfamily)